MQAFNNSGPRNNNDNLTAFLGNLHHSTVQGDIDKLFQGLDLSEVRIARDKETDQPRGYGYAVFKSEEQLAKALERNGTMVCGQAVKVQTKRPRDPNRVNNGRGGNDRGGQSGSGGPSRNDFPSAFGSSRRQHEGQRQQTTEEASLPNFPPFKAYIGNLPPGAEEDDLRQMFSGLSIVGVNMPEDRETKQKKGHGFVEFADQNALKSALVLNGAPWMDYVLKVAVAEGRSNQFRSGGGMGGGNDSSAFGGSNRPSQGFSDRDGGGGMRTRTQRPPAPIEPEPINDGAQRPKLALKPRTAPKKDESEVAVVSGTKPNPFGSAKPVDTAAKLRQLDAQKKIADEAKRLTEKPAADAAPATPTA